MQVSPKDEARVSKFQLRQYQELLFHKACKENVIICLPTGAGKTMIAISVILHKLNETIGNYPASARRTFFLAPNKYLVDQHKRTLNSHLPASVCCLTGDDKPEDFDKLKWDILLEKHQVFIMTPAILVEMMTKGYIKITNINLLVVDELHWAIKKGDKHSNHPYSRLMELYHKQTSDKFCLKPRIIALSASLLNYFSYDMSPVFRTLEQMFDGKICTENYGNYIKEAKQYLLFYKSDPLNFSKICFDFKYAYNICENFCKTKEKKVRDYFKPISLIFRQVPIVLYETMGPWFAYELITMYQECIQSLGVDFIKELKVIFSYIQRQIISNYCPDGDLKKIALTEGHFINCRVLTLLKAIKLRFEMFPNNSSCIVFVQERIEANLLYRWFMFLSKNFLEYSILKPGFICGSFSKDFLRFDRLYNQVEFREKFLKKELNLMFATSVLEEGIDVPVCNTVIRYDFPVNYRVFCQSRGRARDRNSHYYLMVNVENEKEAIRKVASYIIDDKALRKKAWEQNQQDQKDLEMDQDEFDIMESYNNGYSELNPKECLAILNNYISRLSCDIFTERSVNYIFFEKEETCNISKFAYAFVFPINSPFPGHVVVGAYFNTKKAAKYHCSYRVCKFLLLQEELDKHLNVWHESFLLEKHVDALNVRERSSMSDQKKELSHVTNKIYPRPTSKYFSEIYNFSQIQQQQEMPVTYYFYSLEFTHTSNEIDKEMMQQFYKPKFFMDPSQSKRSTIGLLLSQRFPTANLESFFYFNLFQTKFSMKYDGEIQFSKANQSKFNLIKFFNRHLMDNYILDANKKIAFPEHNHFGLYALPVRQKKDKLDIDYELMQRLVDWHDEYWRLNGDATLKPNEPVYSLEQLVPYDHTSLDSKEFTIFSCFHNKKMDLYFAKPSSKISLIKPTDIIIDKNMTYCQHFAETYSRNLVNLENNSMAKGCHMAKWKNNFNLLPQKYSIYREKTVESINNLLPLELITIYPIASSLFLKLMALPMIVFRLEQYCVAQEFLKTMSSHIQVVYDHHFDIEQIVLKSKDDYSQSDFEINKSDDLKLINFSQVEKQTVKKSAQAEVLENIACQEMQIQLEQTPLELNADACLDILKTLGEKLASSRPIEGGQLLQLLKKEEDVIGYGDISLFMFNGDIKEYIDINLDTFDRVRCPNPFQILQALTLRKAHDLWNIERLETIGDTFIKMTTCLYMFYNYSTYTEGKLNYLKMALISNKNLYKIAIEKDIQSRIFTKYELNSVRDFMKNLFLEKHQVNLIEQELKYKDIADCVEALIGAFLVYGGAGSAVAFLDFIDLKAFNPTKVNASTLTQSLNVKQEFNILPNNDKKIYDEIPLDQIYSKLNEFSGKSPKSVEEIYTNFNYSHLENQIDYKFKNKSYLVQALTHPSAMYDLQYTLIISSYQKLEFIGDSILDYVITYHIYNHNCSLKPSAISTLRAALVNNFFYASVVVKYGLHKYIRYQSISLRQLIVKFVAKFNMKYLEQLRSLLYESITEENLDTDLMSSDDIEIDEVDAPKVLSDIFEAIIGAIYIDSSFSLNTVWRVVYRMIKLEMDHFMSNIPVMPIHRLTTEYVNRYSFSQIEHDDKTMTFKIVLTVEMDDEKVTFEGAGKNTKQCKLSATKRFFAYKRKKEQSLPGKPDNVM